jgi:hypothetical protein
MMKANKKHAGSAVWIQLSEKIKDADDDRNRDANELREEIYMILGKKELKVTIPKNSKALTHFTQKAVDF